MNKYDYYISNIFFPKSITKFSSKQYKKLINNKYKYKNIIKYLLNRYSDNYYNRIDNLNFLLKEILFRIKYHIEIIPKCKNCNKKLKITFKPNKLYSVFCSYKCSNSYSEKIKKYEITCINKYGVKSTWQQQKSRIKAQNTFKSYYSQNKLNNTKRKNRTFNTSKPENESYQLLKEKYPDVIYQYRSKEYPFNCDFYIPSLDLYIECNYHWTHGKHPYNKDSKEDNIILEKWKSKSTKYYNNAINTWTIRDPNKRKIAKEKNINFIEFFNIYKLKMWLKYSI